MMDLCNRIMWVICIWMLYIYNVSLFCFMCNILELRVEKRKIVTYLPIAVTALSIGLIWFHVFLPTLYMILAVVYMLIFSFVFNEGFSNIVITCLNTMFHLILIRDGSIIIIALCLGKSVYAINENSVWYLFSFIVTGLCMIGVGMLYNNKMSLQMVKAMLFHKNTLYSIVVTKATLVVLMVALAYIDCYLVNDRMTTIVVLLCYGLMCTCFYCLFIMELKSIRWIENEMIHKITVMQLDYQKQLYSKQSECDELLKVYRHDHKCVLENALQFLENDEPQEAKRLLKQADDQLVEILQLHNRNSNSLIVDVILSGLEKKCRQQGIKFTSSCYVPEDIHITELEFSKIFNNIANNALEACMKQSDDEDRWIIFKSYVKDKKLVIYEQNSFNGIIRYERNKLATTKVERKLHGIGMNSIQYTVEGLDGMCMHKADQKKKVFEMLIKIPLK